MTLAEIKRLLRYTPAAELAEKWGVHRSTIYRMRQRYGIAPPQRRGGPGGKPKIKPDAP